MKALYRTILFTALGPLIGFLALGMPDILRTGDLPSIKDSHSLALVVAYMFGSIPCFITGAASEWIEENAANRWYMVGGFALVGGVTWAIGPIAMGDRNITLSVALIGVLVTLTCILICWGLEALFRLSLRRPSGRHPPIADVQNVSSTHHRSDKTT